MNILHPIIRLGRGSLFLWKTLLALPALMLRFNLVTQQMYSVGVQTLMIIIVAGAFVGMVLAIQLYYTLNTFGAADTLGLLIDLALVRELAPVVAALLFAGRAGSALTAEIGLMKATEQLAALEMMAVDPVHRVIAPRFLAGFLSLPLLVMIFSVVGIIGGHFIGVDLLGVDAGAFWALIQEKVDFYDDVLNGIIKSVIFGFIVSWIAVFEGYDCTPTSEGVAQATTRTVVNASLAVLGMDFILTAIMFN